MNNNSDLREYIDLTLARKTMYGFLSRIFLNEPTKEIVEKVRNPDFLSNLSEMEFKGALDHFDRFSERFKGDLNTLSAEYSKLFLIPDKKYYVTPYESVYLTGLLSQAPTMYVKKIFDREGLEISQDFDDFPDHIGIELEYMHFLCGREAEGRESDKNEETLRYLNKEMEFINEHLLLWVPKLSEKILANSNHDFYKGIAFLLRSFIDYDRDLIREFIDSESR
jgi:TorA maturation chaperone TorD